MSSGMLHLDLLVWKPVFPREFRLPQQVSNWGHQQRQNARKLNVHLLTIAAPRTFDGSSFHQENHSACCCLPLMNLHVVNWQIASHPPLGLTPLDYDCRCSQLVLQVSRSLPKPSPTQVSHPRSKAGFVECLIGLHLEVCYSPMNIDRCLSVKVISRFQMQFCVNEHK